MRLLEVLPTYPGDPFDGSAVYERNLNQALLARGTDIQVLTTRAVRLRHERAFSIVWPNELPERDEHDGVSIRRFPTCDTARIGHLASHSIERRWGREEFEAGAIVPGSARFLEAAVAQARSRPSRFDLLADIGRGPLSPRLIVELARCVSRFDAVLAGYAPFSLGRQVLYATARSGIPVVLLPFIHENDRYHLFNSLLRTYELAAAVFTLGRHTSDFLQAHVPGSNPVTLGAGITNACSTKLSGAGFRAQYGLGQLPLVLFVGRKEHGKRYDLAVSAVEMLSTDAVLVIVGRDVDGKPIRSGRVRQLGVLPDESLAAAYEACDVFVLPSEFESFGMVFLDAWLRSKPVIGNARCAAAACLIEDGVDGFLCHDAREIASAISRLIADRDLRARMGAAGRAKTLRDYTWQRVGDRALAALDELVDGFARP